MVRRKIIWSEKAIDDKLAVFNYWNSELDSNQFSKKLDRLFNHSVEILAFYPQSGRITNHKNIRVKIVNNYLVFYEFSEGSITVIRIWDSRRNTEKMKF